MTSGEAKKARLYADAKTSAGANSRLGGEVLPPARRSIRRDRIIRGARLRPVDPEGAAAIAVSMLEQGQITPILVRPVRMDGDDVWYGLVAGAHRDDAAEINGWTHIDATIRELTDAQALMIEIDENLIRRGLTAYERALFIDARLTAWAELNPTRVVAGDDGAQTAKRGRPANTDKMSEFLGTTPATMGFSAETAMDLGINEKTVRRALTVARGLSTAVHGKISGTQLGRNEGLLRQIAGVSNQAEQLRIVEALTDGRATKFADAQVYAAGKVPVKAPETPVDEALKAFQKVWKAAPASHRGAMLNWLSGQSLPTGWSVSQARAND